VAYDDAASASASEADSSDSSSGLTIGYTDSDALSTSASRDIASSTDSIDTTDHSDENSSSTTSNFQAEGALSGTYDHAEQEASESASARNNDEFKDEYEKTENKVETKDVEATTNDANQTVTNIAEVTNTDRQNKSEKNVLILSGSSQAGITALSTVNAVGSGVSVQTNIMSATGSLNGAINQSNVANVTNGL